VGCAWTGCGLDGAGPGQRGVHFEREEIYYRLLCGGLPPFFLAETLPERDFQEWIDAYWAKDIQEFFRLERRHTFQNFAELLLAQSGGNL
jgi:hypothetical protein